MKDVPGMESAMNARNIIRNQAARLHAGSEKVLFTILNLQ